MSQCVDAGRDTLICSYNYAVQGSPIGGTWEYVCEDSTRWVEMRAGVPGSLVITVEKCGVYPFVYSVNDMMGCNESDTVWISFEEPGSQDRRISYEVDLSYGSHNCPEPPIDSCGNIRILPSATPPQPIWSIDIIGICDATFPRAILSNLDSSNCTGTINHLGANVLDTVVENWTSSQTPIVQTDPDRGIILNNRFAAFLKILDDDIMSKMDSACAPFEKCFVDKGMCVDTLYDTLQIIVPVHIGGFWSLIDSSGIHNLMDTTDVLIGGSLKRLIIASGYRYFGPDDLQFELYSVGGNGETIDLENTTELTFFWTEEWVEDTIDRIIPRRVFNGNCMTCGSRSLIIEPLSVPAIPSTFCPTVTLAFDPPINAEIGGDTVLCQDGFIIVEGPAGFSEYEWSNGTTSRFNFVTLPGILQLRVTDAQGCTASTSVEIESVPKPFYEVVYDSSEFCQGNCTDFSIAGNDIVSYIWSNGTEDTTAVYCFGVQDITVSVELTDINGCRYTETIVVEVQPTDPISAGPDIQITCKDPIARLLPDSVGLQGVPYYQWLGPGINAGNQFDIHAEVDKEGIYVLLNGPNANSCFGRDTMIVRLFDDRPDVDAGQDKLLNCMVNETTLAGQVSDLGSPNISFHWEGPDIDSIKGSTLSIVVNRSGKYILFGCNDITGCCSSDTVIVTSNTNQPRSDAGSDKTLTCETTTVKLGGANTSVGSNIMYIWTGPDIDQTNENSKNPFVQVVGTYFLRVIDTRSKCESVDAVRVRMIGQIPIAKAGPDMTLNCIYNSVTLSSAGSSSGVSIGLEWDGPGINAGNRFSPQVTISAAGTYVLIVTDSIGNCVSRDTVLVDMDRTVPEITAGPDLVIDCETTDVTLLANIINDNGRMNIVWSGPDIGFSNKFKLNPEVSLGGRYILIVNDTLSHCISRDTVFVIENYEPPAISVSGDTELNCNIQTINLSARLMGFDPVVNDFYWEGPDIAMSTRDQLDQIISLPGRYIANVTSLNKNCNNSDTIDVTIDTIPPTLDAGQDRVFGCRGDSLTIEVLSSSVLNNIQWRTVDGVILGGTTGPIIIAGSVGTYIVTAVGENGCEGSDTVEAKAWDEFRLRVDTLSGTCAGENEGIVRFGVINGSFPFEFSVDGNAFTGNFVFAGLSSGLHNVTIKDADGCVKSFAFGIPLIDVFNLPQDTIEVRLCDDPNPIFIGDDFGYTSARISWIDDRTAQVNRLINESGTYTLEFSNDCDTATVVYEVVSDMIIPGEDILDFPNVFSPNGDNLNDAFGPNFKIAIDDSNVRGYEFTIFNRWGEMVFQTRSPDAKWDGRSQGEESMLEVYLYVLKGEVMDCAGQRESLNRTGDVTLMR